MQTERQENKIVYEEALLPSRSGVTQKRKRVFAAQHPQPIKLNLPNPIELA
jgi:hypothetical protein